MEKMIVFVNIFCCPALALWMYYGRENEKLKLNGKSLCLYAVFVACNMPFTKGIVVIINSVFEILVSLDSTYYTVLALCTAFLMPYLYEIVKKNFSVKCKIEKKERNVDEEN